MERLAFDVFHYDIHLIGGVFNGMDCGDVRMVEGRGRLWLDLESFAFITVFGNMLSHEFDRHIAFESGVLGFIRIPISPRPISSSIL